MRHKIILYFLFLAFSQAVGQNTRVLTYEEAVKVALKESYTIKSYSGEKQAMQYSFQYYRAMFRPRLDFELFTPSWNENINPIYSADSLPVYNSFGSVQFAGDLKFTYVLPTGGNFALHSRMYREHLKTVLAGQNYTELQSNQAYSRVGISFDQPVFTKNTLRENLKEAEYEYKKSSFYFTRAQMDIVYNVAKGFYSLYNIKGEMEIAKEKFENSEEAYRISKLKSEAGRIPEGDVLIAEIAVAQNKAKLSETEGYFKREENNFKQLIGLDLSENIEIVTSLEYDTFPIDLGKAVDEALKNRLEISETELDIKLQQIEIDRAKRESELKGNISAYYDVTGISTLIDGSTRELFQSSFDNFVDRPPNRGVTFTLTIPIYDWGRKTAKVQRESVKLKQSYLDLENTKTTIIREVNDIIRTVEETKNRLKIYEKNQQIAMKSYDISKMRFENGDITNQQLGLEQERLSEVKLAYLGTYITYQLVIADLKRKTMWDFENNRSYLIEEKKE